MNHHVNSTILLGVLAETPELQFTNAQVPFMKLLIRTETMAPPKVGGQPEPVSTTHKCTVFGYYAESLKDRLVQGATVLLKGAYEQREFRDQKTGAVRIYNALRAQRLYVLAPPPQQQAQATIPAPAGQQQQYVQQAQQQVQQAQQPAPAQQVQQAIDDLPF